MYIVSPFLNLRNLTNLHNLCTIYIYVCMNASLTYRIFETNNLLSYGKLFDYLKNSIINSISVLRGP